MRLLWVASQDAVLEAERFQNIATGFTVETAPSGWEGIERLAVASYDAVLASFPIPDWTPEEFLEEVQRIHALTPVIIREYSGSFRSAVHMTKLGAYHYVDNQVPDRELASVVESAVEYRRSRELALFGGVKGT